MPRGCGLVRVGLEAQPPRLALVAVFPACAEGLQAGQNQGVSGEREDPDVGQAPWNGHGPVCGVCCGTNAVCLPVDGDADGVPRVGQQLISGALLAAAAHGNESEKHCVNIQCLCGSRAGGRGLEEFVWCYAHAGYRLDLVAVQPGFQVGLVQHHDRPLVLLGRGQVWVRPVHARHERRRVGVLGEHGAARPVLWGSLPGNGALRPIAGRWIIAVDDASRHV